MNYRITDLEHCVNNINRNIERMKQKQGWANREEIEKDRLVEGKFKVLEDKFKVLEDKLSRLEKLIEDISR